MRERGADAVGGPEDHGPGAVAVPEVVGRRCGRGTGDHVRRLRHGHYAGGSAARRGARASEPPSEFRGPEESYVRVRVRVPTLLVVCALVGSLAVAAPGGAQTGTPGTTVAAGSPVRIGLEGPLTGSQQAYGQGMLKGAQLAADRLNASGGILGRKIEIVPIDDQAVPATGVANATAAIRAGLDGVIGPYNSGVGAQTLPLYLQAGLVPVRLTSADSTEGLGVTLQPMTSQIAPVAADAITEWLKAKTVAIVYDSTTLYTQKQAETMRTELQANGARIVAFEPIAPGQQSYAGTVGGIRAVAPDVAYLIAYYPEAGLIAKEMHRAKLPVQCLSDFG
ncbi:MAG: hypothetical protein FJW77_07215, partial [Actinobacteria bacterium]|nr:hypothetical protein [Actinomycetota bacterium]